MKKIFLISMLCIFSLSMYAQTEVTKFLGIPVDGYKSEMVQKLKAKGFTPVSGYDNILEGEFNGSNVNVHIVTNNNKVCRIMVSDKSNVGEGDIKIRFNRLCKQFLENGRYLPASIAGYELSDEEDISYEMSVNSKRYEASFFQLPVSIKDSTAMATEMQSILLEKYTPEELSNITDEKKLEISMGMVLNLMEKYSKNSVWFMISEYYGKYYITMFYDNEHNRANGEEL